MADVQGSQKEKEKSLGVCTCSGYILWFANYVLLTWQLIHWARAATLIVPWQSAVCNFKIKPLHEEKWET